jgi:hypothetical protein
MTRFTSKFKQELRDGGLDDGEIRDWEATFNKCRDFSKMLSSITNCNCSSCKHEDRCRELGNIPYGGGECPSGEFDPKT